MGGGRRRSRSKRRRAGGPAFRAFSSRSRIAGAPSLRFLQGRARCCLHHVVSGSGSIRPSLQTSVVPALRTEREERGTLLLQTPAALKAWAACPIHAAIRTGLMERTWHGCRGAHPSNTATGWGSIFVTVRGEISGGPAPRGNSQ